MSKRLTKMQKNVFTYALSVNETNKVHVLSEQQKNELIKVCKEQGIENTENRICVEEENKN